MPDEDDDEVDARDEALCPQVACLGYDRHTPIGWRFMDKFVQLPFTIPPAEPDSFEDYAQSLVGETEEIETLAEPLREVRQLAQVTISQNEVRAQAARISREYDLNPEVAEAIERMAMTELALHRQDQLSEGFRDSHPDVRDMLLSAAHAYSRNPRDIKRLLNVIRFQYLLSRGRIAFDKPIPTNEQIARWVVLMLKWPAFVRWLRWSPARYHLGETQSATSDDVRHRLDMLERVASLANDQSAWRNGIMYNLGLTESEVHWLDDPGLHLFFTREMWPEGERLSAGAGLGIY